MDTEVKERAVYTVAEAAKLLGVGTKQTYEAVYDGTIPSFRIGRRILIPRRAFEKFLDAGTAHKG